MRKHILVSLLLVCSLSLSAQYTFTPDQQLNCTEVKSQDRTGTCWSFATLSFLESELMRMGKSEIDLSEMYIVRNIYQDKARNYILRQGLANFSEGALSHDVIRGVQMAGVVPESVFAGREEGAIHDHSEMSVVLKAVLDRALGKEKKYPKAAKKAAKGISCELDLEKREMFSQWKDKFSCILDHYLGSAPSEFMVDGQSFTPQEYAKELGIVPSEYVTFTSFTHHPYYESFILEIPDNYSNGSYLNVPLAEMKKVVDEALAKGYTVAWDGDVSEATFSARQGIAILPTNPGREDVFTKPGAEVEVTAEMRQKAFESFSTTDDHLMHLVGTAKDQAGNRYYVIKNSWGEIGPHEGFLYMSEAYFLMKTVGIMVHKSAIPASIDLM